MKNKTSNKFVIVIFFLVLAVTNILAFFYMTVLFNETLLGVSLVKETNKIPDVKNYTAVELKSLSVKCESCSDNYLDYNDCKNLIDSSIKVQKITKYKQNEIVYCSFFYYE